MGRSMLLLFSILTVAPFFTAGQFIGYTGPCAQTPGGVRVGELPTLDHSVSGTLWLERAGRFCIENFTYDGLAPDAFLYFYYPGDEVREDGGGYAVRLNDQRAQFTEGRAYQGETFRFALPERAPVACDFGNFSIWCRYASILFTVLEINSNIFGTATVNRTSVACSMSPGRVFMGVLPNLFHELGGELFVKDNKTIIIRNFNYDGLGPDAFVYWYPVGMEADELGNGNIIPVGDPNVNEGAFVVNRRYTNELFELRIPDNLDVYTCDIGTFTIWCRQFTQWFTRLEFDTALFTNSLRVNYYNPSLIYCNRPATQPGVYIGELPTDSTSDIVSGAVYVVDEYQLFIQLFNYHPDPAGCTNAQLYFYVDGQEVQGSGGGYTISFSQTQKSLPGFFTNEDITVDLRYARVNARTCDIKYLTVWCQSSEMHLSTLEIPASTFTDNIRDSDAIFCEKRVSTDGATPTVAVSGVFIGLLVLATSIFKP